VSFEFLNKIDHSKALQKRVPKPKDIQFQARHVKKYVEISDCDQVEKGMMCLRGFSTQSCFLV
jgi:hypothetical protein